MTNYSKTIDMFPLSPMQQGMLFHHLKEPHSGVDIQQLTVHLPEFIEAARLKAAWKWLLQRHDILRSRFVWQDVGEPSQEVFSNVPLPFAVEDIRTLNESDQKARLTTFLDADRIQGFDLNHAPLMRLKLFQQGDASFLLIWTFHHAILDGRCYPILLKEVFDAYEELATGGIKERPAPTPFRKYIDWIREQDMARSEPFWKGLLNGFTAPIPLVVDHMNPVSPARSPQGEVWDEIGSETTALLRTIVSTYDLTLNAMVMGAWAVLLYRYSGETDIVFGATRACRKSSIESADETIGLFINTVPVRAQMNPNDQFVAMVQRLRKQWLNIRPHEHSPLTMVKTVSQVPTSRPLFETLVVFEKQRLDRALASFGGCWLSRDIKLHELTNFPVTLAAYDGDTLSFKLEFNQSRIDEPTARRLVRHLRRLLEGVASLPESRVRELPLLTEHERIELLHTFNNSNDESIAYDSTIHGLFESRLAAYSESVAVSCDGRSLSYRELNERGNQVAHYLRKLGVGHDVLVGLFLERSLDMVVGLLGVLKAGGAYVPIDPEYPADRVEFMLEDAAAPVLLVQGQLRSQLPPYRGTVLSLDDDWELIAAEPTTNPSHAVDPGDLAYMIYTSGSTGKPKGAMNAHRGICNRLLWMQNQYGLTADDSVLQKTPFSFDVSVWEFFWPLLVGARLVLAKPGGHRDPVYLIDVIEKERITIMHFVPSMLAAFLATAGLDRCQTLRHVICSGEALPFSLQEEFFASLPAQLHNLYGPTEAAIDVTHWTCRRHDERRIVPIGRPVANTQMYVLDRQLQPVPIGVAGELYIGGIQVGRGYHNRPELTAERFVPDHLGGRVGGRLYKTGDLARFLPGGEIEYLGRADFQVKIRGFRIELGEIEARLLEHPAIREAVVIAREDQPGIKRLVAYLISTLSERNLDAIRDHLKAALPEFMVPAVFVFLEKLPLSPNGKIARKALPAPAQGQDLDERYVAPSTDVEKKLTAIWAEILRVEQVGIHDNFFELGGDSILSIQAIARARREGIKMTPMMLFANQTIAELAVVVGAADEAISTEGLASGDVPLMPIQHWFFEQNLEKNHHFNQAFLFELVEPLERSVLERAVEELGNQHDALRLRFHRNEDAWRQHYATAKEPSVLQWVDLSTVEKSLRVKELESITAAAQAGLNLQEGPIWRVLYFMMGDGMADRLFFVIHHLAVDGVSWRPLLEDFETACLQLKSGHEVVLPPKTASYRTWARSVQRMAESTTVRNTLPYWKGVVDHKQAGNDGACLGPSNQDNRERDAQTLKLSLSPKDTQALLMQVPAVYNTQINDLLLTALARAWGRWSRQPSLHVDVEGHGREQLLGDLDTSRTVGWFTAIYPVRLHGGDTAELWRPGEALKSVKEQLRAIPQRGVGYGLLRYLTTDSGLGSGSESRILFNYFGRFDQVLTGLKLLRFAKESSGPWRSPVQQRRYALEINCMVLDGRFEVWWTFGQSDSAPQGMQQFADTYLASLRELIAHCQSPSAGGRTPSDFPLAGLDQPSVDHLWTERQDLEDVYPLSPIQTLFFFSGDVDAGTVFDHWHCTLTGPLNVPVFQRAWQEMVQRHSVLRSTVHGKGFCQPMQVVHREVQLPWTIEDWRDRSLQDAERQWREFLESDSKRPLRLTEAPVMRFSLVRLADDRWKFVWTVPALLLDGWSWPLVFRDASRLYEAFESHRPGKLAAVRPYRDYLEWLSHQSKDVALAFWKEKLACFREPTAIGVETTRGSAGDKRFTEHGRSLSREATLQLSATTRQLKLTLNTMVQAAWAILLSRIAQTQDVVFGASFSARPTDLAGAEAIVGPFVNNLPVRVSVDPAISAGDFLRRTHENLLQLSPYQYTPLVDVRRVSEVPWRHRLFDSLVVFQNYLVDESARQFGAQVSVSEFSGPIHTNYPVLLLAEPGAELGLTLVGDRLRIGEATRERWIRDVVHLLETLPHSLDRLIGEVLSQLTAQPAVKNGSARAASVETQHVVPPQTELERTIAGVWQGLFGIERISVEDNFFDLGGHSMLMVQMHGRLKEVLTRDFPIVTLLQHPSIRSLASCFEQEGTTDGIADRVRDRAKKQKEAFSRLRALGRGE